MISDTTERLFAGYDEPDVASLEANGHFYVCFVWLNRSAWRVEAQCFVELADGQRVEVFRNVVAELSASDISSGWIMDAPRILASGATFVVHWVQQTDEAQVGEIVLRELELFRATQPMEAFVATSWDNRGSVGIYHYGIYDAQPIEGHASDFVVAICSSDDQIDVRRFEGLDWIDTTWSESIDGANTPGFTMEARVLAVYGSDTDNDVIACYHQTVHGALMAAHFDADDGSGLAVDVALDFDTGGPRYVNAGLCRFATREAVVIAEAMTGLVAEGGTNVPLNFVHHVVYARLNTRTGARIGNQHGAPNLSLHSRPWTFPNGRTATGTVNDAYAVVGYKSVGPTSDWSQAYLFVVNLEVALWGLVVGPSDEGEGGTSTWGAAINGPSFNGIRPRPIGTVYTVGLPDARPAGYSIASGSSQSTNTRGPIRNVNLLSSVAGAPSFGPNCKTRTIAIGVWAGLQTQSIDEDGDGTPDGSEFGPINAGVQGLIAFMEDPWAIWRDGRTQPVDNFVGVYSRAMCQTVEVGRSLFVSGGTPYVYDGKQTVECGYLYKPEIFDAQAQEDEDLDPGFGLQGTYQWIVCWTWRDNAGQLHRSAPSAPFQGSVAGDDNVMVLRVRSMSLSLRDANIYDTLAEPIQLELYRTESTGSIFYRVYGGENAMTGASNPQFRAQDTPINSPNATYIDIFDAVPDATLVLQGLSPYQPTTLYPPETTPAFTCCAFWRNRVFAVDACDTALIWYSDEVLPDLGAGGQFYQAPQFNSGRTFRIGEIGEITALRAMNDSLIVESGTAIMSLQADDAGDGLLSLSAEVLHEGTGCIEPRSVVLGPPGIFSQTAKGYYLIDRGRQLDYISAGASVEDEIRDAGNVRAATLLVDKHQIKLATNGRPVTHWVTTLTVITGDEAGTWSFIADGYPAAEFEGGASSTNGQIAIGLAAAITALLPYAAANMDDLIESATPSGSTVRIVWQPDVVPDYTLDDAPGGVLSAVDTSSIETFPRVLVHDYLQKMWARHDLRQSVDVDPATDPRMSEVVDGCAWQGVDGGTANVVLTQGALLLERGPRDPVRYADNGPDGTGNFGIPIDVRTSWLHFAGVSGYMRVSECGVQAQRTNDAQVFADVDYDRDGSFRAEHPISSTYEWTSTTPGYFRIRQREQKITAMRLRIYEAANTPATENIEIVAFSFVVGTLGRLRRVGQAQTGT